VIVISPVNVVGGSPKTWVVSGATPQVTGHFRINHGPLCTTGLWQHLHFLGHYAIRHKRNPIDLEAVLAGIDWE